LLVSSAASAAAGKTAGIAAVSAIKPTSASRLVIVMFFPPQASL
jgi:hypothetical protein